MRGVYRDGGRGRLQHGREFSDRLSGRVRLHRLPRVREHVHALARVLVLAIASCAASPPASTRPAQSSGPAHTERVERFEALLTIDEKPGAKKFQGVWLEREDGERFVVSYRVHPWFEGFAGHRVKVTGERYEPKGQAIMAPHFRVHTLEIAGDPKEAPMPSVLRLGAETKLRGEFEVRTVSSGAKGAGERYQVFVSDAGTTYYVTGSIEPGLMGKQVDIVGRESEPSPFYAAMRGGRYLWLIDQQSTGDP